MSKIFNRNINLDEFLDETIIVQNDLISEDNNIDLEIIENNIGLEIIEADDIDSDVSFEINKCKGKKKLILTVNLYEGDEMIKLDFEIQKSTLKKLLKDLED